jgi:hypothetical protein
VLLPFPLQLIETNRIVAHYTAYEKCRVALAIEGLTADRIQHNDEWNTIRSDVPYQLGNNPFSSLYNLALETIRGELQLWGTSFPSTVESLKVLANIADVVVNQMVEAVEPILHARQSADLIIQVKGFLMLCRFF